MVEAPSASTEPTDQKPPGTGSWLVACLVVTTALSLVAAHVPSRVRLLGLFSVAFGLLLGWIVVQLTEKLKPGLSRRSFAVFAALLTLAGLIGSTCEIWRLDAATRKPSMNESLAMQMAEQMKESSPKEGEATPGPVNTLSEVLDTSFRRHLARRVRQLGDLKSPWPEILWVAELLAGTAASYWIVNRFRPG